MRSSKSLLAPLFVSLTLSACTLGGPRVAGLPPQPRGIEGNWRSAAGPVDYVAAFNSGRFTSIESNTGTILAEGTYDSTGPGQVNILYTSTTRGDRIAANCNQIAPNRLSCATSTGSRFDLVR